jgi:hypothetical protein
MERAMKTDATALCADQLELLKDNQAKLRSSMQAIIKHIKGCKAAYATADQAAEPVTKGLHEVLRQKIAAGLKLK